MTLAFGGILGGCAIYLAGHALFKVQVFKVWSWQRVVAALVLLGAAPVGLQMPALLVSILAAGVLLGVVVADRVVYRQIN